MSLVAICPGCNLENAASNTICDMCGTALGATIVQTETRSATKWIGYSVLLSAVFAMVSYILGLSGLYLFVAAFYGAMIASYQCESNVVLETSIGAVGGLFAAFCVIMVFEPGALRALARNASATSSTSKVVLLYGLLIALPVVYVSSLVGAVSGELLRQRRRRRRAGGAL